MEVKLTLRRGCELECKMRWKGEITEEGEGKKENVLNENELSLYHAILIVKVCMQA